MNSSLNASKILIDEDVKTEISQDEAEKAVKILIEYICENPNREGLLETPKRVIKSFKEFESTEERECYLAGTVMQIKERKTAKPNASGGTNTNQGGFKGGAAGGTSSSTF